MSARGWVSLADAPQVRDELLRDGIPPAIRAAAVERARALRQAAVQAAFDRLGLALHGAVAGLAGALASALARRRRSGGRHLRAG